MPRARRSSVKILYHHRTLSEDGQAVHIRALQQAFREEGHTVEEFALVGRDASDGAEAEESSGGSRWSWVSRMPRFVHELAEYAYSGVARGRILSHAAAFTPDFLYERYAFGNAAGVLAGRRLGCPVVLEVNSPMVLELSRTRGLSFPRTAEKLERFVFRGADAVCVVTRVLGDMLEEMGVAPERLLVTPNGVHPELYAHPTDAAEAADLARVAREGLGLAGDSPGPVLGFVGYYRDWHRLDLVVEALAAPELMDARLVLVGDGPAGEGLRARAEELGVEARLVFAGRREHAQIPALLPAFDVALVPAINPYASPLKLHEYMAAGRAVVAPDQPNLREVLTDGENGLLVPAGDGPALREVLIRLVGDSELRERLGAAARATIEREELTWRGNARRVVERVETLR